MKSGAPGGFDCESYISAWASGLHTEVALRHIENCELCLRVIYGDGTSLSTTAMQDAEIKIHFRQAKELMESGVNPFQYERRGITPEQREVLERIGAELREEDEEFDRLFEETHGKGEGVASRPAAVEAESVAELELVEPTLRPLAERPMNRRRFLVRGTVAAGLIGLGVWGGMALQQMQSGSRPRTLVETSLDSNAKSFEQIFATAGKDGIAKVVSQGSIDDAKKVLYWIRTKSKVPLYEVLANATADMRPDVRSAAVGMCYLVVPLDLKPYLPTLQASLAAETDPVIKSTLLAVVERVAAS